MLKIYMPYVNIKESVECLSAKDCAVMKHNSAMLIDIIAHKKGWRPISEDICDYYEDDEFLRYFYNEGAPMFEFLLNYYTECYISHLKHGGGEIDFISEDREKVYEINKNEIVGLKWGVAEALNHKMILLKHDYQYYKRKFRDFYIYEVENLNYFKNGKPCKLTMSKLKQCKDAVIVDHLSKFHVR